MLVLLAPAAQAVISVRMPDASNQPPPLEDYNAFECDTALKEGVAYCNTVFDGMTDQRGAETVPFVFGPTPRLSVLYFSVTHTYEHYGNLVTYMRLNKIVPPSSEPRKPE